MNSYPAALSRGRPGRTCILMQSAYGQECILLAVHCVWKRLSILNARMGCTAGSARSMQSKAQHNLYQRMRACKDPKESHSDPDCGSSTSPLQGKTSAYSCPGSSLVHWRCWSAGRTESRRHWSRSANWSMGFGLANHVGTSGLVPGLDLCSYSHFTWLPRTCTCC